LRVERRRRVRLRHAARLAQNAEDSLELLFYLSRRAQKDLDRIDARDRERIAQVLSKATPEAMKAGGLDIVPLVGSPPWRRLRIGTYRVLFMPTKAAGGGRSTAYLVARIVHRRDLEEARDSLE
jgi:mRNA-degrading endonuclease RelE of RelBE toxin-antitoxin system